MAGGSQISISDKGIIITTNGKIIYKAEQHQFEGGQMQHPVIPAMPITQLKSQDVSLEYFHADGTPAKGAKYTLTLSDGSEKTGFLDEKGQAFVRDVPLGQAKVIYEPEFSENDQSLSMDDSWFKNFIKSKGIK